jgi:hypothetical protein
MKNKSLLASLALFAALLVAVPVLAKPVSAVLPLFHPARVGQTKLDAGQYRILIDGEHMSIYKGKGQVAEAQGRWEDRNDKSPSDSIVLGADGSVIEVRFEGRKSVFVLAH